MTSKTITVITKNVYGNELLYVASEQASDIKTLTGKETVNQDDIQALEGLGFVVRQLSLTLNR